MEIDYNSELSYLHLENIAYQLIVSGKTEDANAILKIIELRMRRERILNS